MRLLLVGIFLFYSYVAAAEKSEDNRQLQALLSILDAINHEKFEPFTLTNKTAVDKLVEALKGTSSYIELLSKESKPNDEAGTVLAKLKEALVANWTLSQSTEDDGERSITNKADLKILNEKLRQPNYHKWKVFSAFLKDQSASNKKNFEEECAGNNAPLKQVDFVLKNAADLLSRQYVASTGSITMDAAKSIKVSMNDTKFLKLVGNLRQNIFSSYLMHVASSRLGNPKFDDEMPKLIEKFIADGKELEKTITKESKKFYKGFLNSAHIDIRAVLGGYKVMPAELVTVANAIYDSLVKMCPEREYVVLIYEEVSGDDKVAVLAIDSDFMVTVKFKGYVVLVVLTTENYKENTKKYQALGSAKHLQLFNESYDGSNLKTSLEKYQKKLGEKLGSLFAINLGRRVAYSLYYDDAYDAFVYRPNGESPCPDEHTCHVSDEQETDTYVATVH